VFEVRDGNRVLRFDGEHLSGSSSRTHNQDRWVEFNIYRTKSGNYVLERIGHTKLYHALDCSIVERNNLKPSGIENLNDEHLPCELCDPDEYLEVVAIEKPRYFVLVSESPEAVLEALYKYDNSGARYLTHVAQRLIEDACEVDTRLEKAYRIEYIH
jgi:hypothetical protein